MVSRYDNRRACIAPYNSKTQFEYTMGTEIQEVLGTEEGREFGRNEMDQPPVRIGCDEPE
jgi:hypothetical protein